jgi:hypothetical protein
MLKKISIFLLLIWILYACSSVAVTGRKQLNLVPNSEIIPMANQQYKEVITKGPLSSNQQQTQLVKRVGKFRRLLRIIWPVKVHQLS